MTDCASIRPDLAAFLAGGLAPLTASRIEAHLARCGSCGAIVENLQQGLAAARAPVHIDDEALAAIVARVTERAGPPVRTRPRIDIDLELRPRRAPRLAVILAASVASVAAATAIVAIAADSRARPPIVEHVEQDDAPLERAHVAHVEHVDAAAVEPLAIAALGRSEPLDGVRMLAHPGWQGRADRASGVLVIDEGFAALSFTPSGPLQKKRLVRTKAVDIEVVGTRFIVDVREGVTTVAVASGRVRLTGASGTRMLAAGSTVRFIEGSAPIERTLDADLAAILDDEYLRRIEAPIPRSAPTPANCAASAQRAAGNGESARAVELYRRCIDDAPRALRDVMRYEMARLEAFTLRRPSGRAALEALMTSPDHEVARQAALSTCELTLQDDPCGARACLDRLAEPSRDAVLADSARRLVVRWGLVSRCPR